MNHKPIVFTSVCVDCIMGMVEDMFSMLGESRDSIEREIKSFAQREISKALEDGLPAPVLGNSIMREIHNISGCRDPYLDFKKRELEYAREIFSRITDNVGDDLRSGAAISVLGNSLDFFTSPDEVLFSLPDVIKNGVDFFHDELKRLEHFLLEKPGLVLFFQTIQVRYFLIFLYTDISRKGLNALS